MSEIRVTSVVGESGGDRVGLTTGLTVGPLTGTTGIGATISHQGHAQFVGVCTATSFVPTTGQLSHRNIIINGDMRIAQRATTSTTAGVTTIDRFKFQYSGTDEAPTASQVDVTSGGAYDSGFRKCFKVTNGNQTGGAGTSDMISVDYNFETQDISYSGWNYVSSSSFITLSYWVKSSVAQNFFVTLKSGDGTPQKYATETGSLSANTWTKITKTIPGNSNLQFDTSGATDLGLFLELSMFRGTDKTGTIALDAWNPYGSGTTRTPDQTSTWYTTNDATFEITGVQLEVGPVATPFEHRSFGDELRRCQRYCFRLGGSAAEIYTTLAFAVHANTTVAKAHIIHPVPMRSVAITYSVSGITFDDDVASYNSGNYSSIDSVNNGTTSGTINFITANYGASAGRVTRVLVSTGGGYIQGECEL